ncbi:MAG: hypothetical protein JWO62_2755 [Acidimicrobiaceae bacterium]|jgi:hypothetical protein|nr:hypothetical protein [Acidimicrobiaceae bacterium]
MVAKKVDRDQPAPGRAAVVEVDRVDAEHPKRPLPPIELSATSLGDAIRELKGFESPDAPVVSLYWSVPADLGQLKGGVSKLKDLIKPVRERAASEGLSHEARESLLADADRILELDQLVPKLQGRTLAFFCCNERGFEEAVVLPGGLPDRVELDATPFMRPLVMVHDEAHRYAVVVVDREQGELFDFYLGVLEAKEREHDKALRNPNFAAGDREYGVHHKAQELAKHHYRKVADALVQFLQEDGIELVVVGGHEESVPAFLDVVPHDLHQKVIGTFIVDPHTMTPASVSDVAQRVVDDYERREEEKFVSEAIERVAAGGLGALGIEWCLLATDELAVDRLLVDAYVTEPGRVCDSCGWLGLTGDECPVDGSPTRTTPDVIDEMVTRVLESSGHVEHVHIETPLRDHLVAALLRFPVPQQEGATS